MENPHSLIPLRGSEERLRNRVLRKVRSDLLEKIPDFSMGQERKSYFTHQVLNSHDFEDLMSLVDEINHKQLSEGGDPVFVNLMEILGPHSPTPFAAHHPALF